MPVGRPAKVDHVRDEFLAEIDRAVGLIAAIGSLPAKTKQSAKLGLHPKHSGQIMGLAFMGLIATWEEFLERTLVRYRTGAKTDGGYAPQLKIGRANSLAHAYELLSLNPNYRPESSYLKVTDVRWIQRIADFYFLNHPYGCLGNSSQLLKQANRIRNRVAHDSTKCKAEFKDAVVFFLNPTGGTLKQGYGPASLLRESVQAHSGAQAVTAGVNHFDAYVGLFRHLAGRIVP